MLVSAAALLGIIAILVTNAIRNNVSQDTTSSTTNTAPPPFPATIYGYYEIYDPTDLSGLNQGAPCASWISSSWPGFGKGAIVDVINHADNDSNVLASAYLRGGTVASDGGCVFTFQIDDVPKSAHYGIALAQAGYAGFDSGYSTVWYSLSQMNLMDWNVDLTFGHN